MADDPIHKLLLGRDPVSGAPLASQPTISRFENGARRTVLYRMGRELAASVIERHRRRLHGRARRITIDLDPTDDLTHGAQQLTFFNGHYGGWCYLPMLGFLSFDREAEQYLCAAVLRPGKAVAADGTLGLLCRLLPLLRAAFPRARFLLRLDGGFATPEIFDFPGCGAPARLRRGDGEERGVAAACGVRHAGGPRAERGRWRDRARLYRHTSVPHFQDHASDNWEPEGAGSDGVVNRSWSGRRSNMLSWSTCSIW